MEPSAAELDATPEGSSNRPSNASSSISNIAVLPVNIINLREMSDDSINEILLDRLKTCSAKPNENIDILRASSARLHSRAASQDKETRESTLTLLRSKSSEAMEVLLYLLENVRDHVTAASVAGTIHECIAPKSEKKDGRKIKKKSSTELKKNQHVNGVNRVSTMRRLVELNATSSLVKLVVLVHNREIQASDTLLQELIWILGQLSQRDNKFSIKTRLLNGVRVFHYLLRSHFFSHNKMLSPLLLIMKALAKNGTTVNILIKDGITVTLEKTLTALGFSPNSKLRLLLNVFSYLTRNSKFCVRVVKMGLVQQLLKLFERWERYDGKMRLRICYFTLQTLHHLCSIKAGRAAINNVNGLSLLHKFCQHCPDDVNHDPLLVKTCSIINTCADKREMPIPSAKSPALFPLPVATGITNTVSQTAIDSDDSGDESLDDDPDEEEENEPLEKDQLILEEQPPLNILPAIQNTPQRDLDELYMYNSNWCEMLLPSSKPDHNEKCNGNGLHNNGSLKSLQKLNRVNSVNLQDKKEDIKQHSSINNLKNGSLNIFHGLSRKDKPASSYCKIASKVRSVLPFVKVAYPDMVENIEVDGPDPLFVRDRKSYRTKLLNILEKNIYAEHAMNNVIYDVDRLLTSSKEDSLSFKELSNCDEMRVGSLETSTTSLQFESRFESGNLRKAIQIGPREYDLIVMPDVNSSLHHNWFYFEVSNMDNTLPYTLNIINCDKPNSQFNFGMRPLLYSVKEAMLGRPSWVRAGDDICYFKNSYYCSGKSKKKKSFQTLSFSILFPHNLDVCYMAYHFPYTYSRLLLNLWLWSQRVLPNHIYFRVDNLCNTLNENETPLVTISAPEDRDVKFHERDVIFLTARVHPGETNSSWVMQGSFNFLLNNTMIADKLRSKYVIKIVPMLNPEGVINGCYRCGLSDEDLNRKWREPNPILHSAIFHTKGLIDYSCRVLKKVPYVFCDYHGHSRRKNVFLFGCSPPCNWNQSDNDKESNISDYIILPTMLGSIAPAFDLSQCSFAVEHSKESTARITIWREFGVTRSYTMESSYCGFDVGIYKGNHMAISHLEEMGATFCLALVYLSDDTSWAIRNQIDVQNTLASDSLRETTEPRMEDFFESSDSDYSENELIKSSV
ncbi:cytosolic carboxypeptidase 1-like isoform X2 [Lycorma delicatula]